MIELSKTRRKISRYMPFFYNSDFNFDIATNVIILIYQEQFDKIIETLCKSVFILIFPFFSSFSPLFLAGPSFNNK